MCFRQALAYSYSYVCVCLCVQMYCEHAWHLLALAGVYATIFSLYYGRLLFAQLWPRARMRLDF